MRKKIFLLISTLFLASTVSGLQFNVKVDALTESSEYGVEYRENTTVQQVNTTVLNSGSIGCQFRLKGEFQYGNNTKTRYSGPHALFPGAVSMMQLYFVPENYTGQVQTTLYSEYCGQEKQIKEFNFTSPESVVPNNSIESTTLSVNRTGSQVKAGSESGRLVPQEAPPYWKTGSAELVNGTATIEYDAPIFSKGKNLTYTVLDKHGNVVGETEIHLKTKETMLDRLENNLFKILLGVSVAVNLLLVILRLRETERIKF